MISFIMLHLALVLCSSGAAAAIGIGGSVLGWPVVLKHWKAILAAAVLLVTLVVIVVLYLDLERTKAEEAQYKANFQTIENQAETVNADNQNLVKQLQAQDDSITQAAQESLAVQAQAKLALQAAQAKQEADAGTIAKLQARAATNEGSCDDEIAILRGGL